MSMCGSKRFMYKNAYMLIHQISSVIIQGKFEEFKDEMENQEKLMSQIKSIYLEKSKMSEQQIEDLLKHDLWLPAETCLEYGLVDEIVLQLFYSCKTQIIMILFMYEYFCT